jgi:hypothetical protein
VCLISGWISKRKALGVRKVADPYKRLRRQVDRKRRRERFDEDQLFNVTYRGYTFDQQGFDGQLGFQLDWLGKQK